MIGINIDGIEVNAYKGQTILQVARENGIDIPTLCYDERVKTYGGCGLCVVETEGNPKLLRACATEISPGMIIKTRSERINASRRLTLELLLSDHIGDCRGPCMQACPAHTDIQGYVGLIANQKYRQALELIKEKVPLPASIGRVCPHPCETACRRQLVEEQISIAFLKAFAADLDLKSEKPYIPAIKSATGKKVAIVGAGPAGLTAAYYLAREGHAITVYDAMPAGGGMLRYGIPEYRLPKSVLAQEIELIQQMGVEFRYNTRIGSDISLEFLIKESDAVFLGIGAWVSSPMRCKGEDLPGVNGGIDFLQEVALNGDVQIGDTVAVVGGGNTAMDAARTAIRLGAKNVMVLYRRTRAEMPAEDIEILEAEEEGVDFRFLVAPLEVIAQNGQANAIRVQKMQLGEPDESGRRSPVPIPGEEEIIEVDTIISAIGQQVNATGMGEVALSKWGTIDIDEHTLATNIPGVFAGGDGATGPKTAIAAIAQGGRAAQSIIDYLNGLLLPRLDGYMAEQRDLTPADFSDYEKKARVHMPQLSVEKRRDNFQEVNLGLPARDAADEANRCLECGCRDYFECRLVHYASQYQVKPERLEGERRQEKLQEKYRFFEKNSEKCILCSLCVRVCSEVVGLNILGLVHRGFESIVEPEFNLPLDETACINCGLCVTVCPTGALTEVYPLPKNLPLTMQETATVCSFCGMGCQQIVHSKGDMILQIRPEAGGLLCQNGRFGFSAYENQDRLTQPLLRRNGALVETSWDDAFRHIAERAKRIRARQGNSALAVFMAPSYSLEEATAALNLGKKALGTKNISTFTINSGQDLQSQAPEACSGNLAELQGTDFILVVGAWQDSQVAALKVRLAAQAGAKVLVLSPDATLVDDVAQYRLVPENSTVILKQVLAAVIKEKPAGAGEYRQAVSSVTVGLEAEKIAKIYAEAKNAMIIVDGNSVTPAAVQLLGDLALLTGKTGSPCNGVLVITPGSNQLGLAGLGVINDVILLDAVKSGKIEGLFILGEDPVGAGVLEAKHLEQAELTVVLAPFMTATAAAADVVLPASTALETAGTCIRCDGRKQSLQQVKMPPAGLGNQEILSKLTAALGISPTVPVVTERQDAAPVNFAIPDDSEIFLTLPVLDPARRLLREQLA